MRNCRGSTASRVRPEANVAVPCRDCLSPCIRVRISSAARPLPHSSPTFQDARAVRATQRPDVRDALLAGRRCPRRATSPPRHARGLAAIHAGLSRGAARPRATLCNSGPASVARNAAAGTDPHAVAEHCRRSRLSRTRQRLAGTGSHLPGSPPLPRHRNRPARRRSRRARSRSSPTRSPETPISATPAMRSATFTFFMQFGELVGDRAHLRWNPYAHHYRTSISHRSPARLDSQRRRDRTSIRSIKRRD